MRLMPAEGCERPSAGSAAPLRPAPETAEPQASRSFIVVCASGSAKMLMLKEGF